MDGLYSASWAKSCEDLAWNWSGDAASAFTDYRPPVYGLPLGPDGYFYPLYPPLQNYPSPNLTLNTTSAQNGGKKTQKSGAPSKDSAPTAKGIETPKKNGKVVKKGRPKKNPVWNRFEEIPEKSVLCKHCLKVVKSACATNMSKHMDRHHPEFSKHGGYLSAKKKKEPTVPTVSPDYGNFTYGPPTKKHRKTKHPVWTFFNRDRVGYAHCRLCQSVVRSPCCSNFMGHLNRHHPEEHGQVYSIWISNREQEPRKFSSYLQCNKEAEKPEAVQADSPMLEEDFYINIISL